MLTTTTNRLTAKTSIPTAVHVAPLTSDVHVDALLALRDEIAREGRRTFDRWRPALARSAFGPSALNMAHYLALRKRDLRAFQAALTPWGLSSLGRSEAHVLASLDAVLVSIAQLTGRTDRLLPPRPRAAAFTLGDRLLAR